MYAVFESGGKQFRAEPGLRLRIPALAAEEGSTVTFDRVLITGGADGEPEVGTPTVEGAAVRVVSDFGHIEATLAADAGVPTGSLRVNWLAPGAPANSLIAAGTDITVVEVEAR